MAENKTEKGVEEVDEEVDEEVERQLPEIAKLLKKARMSVLLFVSGDQLITISRSPDGEMGSLEVAEFLADSVAQIVRNLIDSKVHFPE